MFGTGKGLCKTEDHLHCTAQSTTKYETKTSNSSMQRSDTTGSTITSERSTTVNQSSHLGRVDETGRTEKVEHLQGRTDVVHEHFKELFSFSLPMIGGDRVREVAFDFRKSTSCAADHVVELLDRGHGECVENAAGHHGQEKEWQAHDAWFPSDCAAADHLPAVLRCSNCRKGLCNQDMVRNTDMSLVGKPMKWCGCSDEWWNKPRNGKYRFS